MNVAVITTCLNTGGAERIAGLLSKELSKKYNVYLFLLSTENIVYDYGGEIVEIGTVPFYEDSIMHYKELYSIDVAISFLDHMNFANIRTRRNEKIIISERCVQSLFEPPLVAQKYKIMRYYPYADEIVACSYGVKYDLAENYDINSNISVIYNFINKDEVNRKASAQLDSDVEEFLDGKSFFVNIGRLGAQKNQSRLIDQFDIFHKNNKNIKLLIIGSGNLFTALNAKIINRHLENWVKIIPYTTNPFVFIKNARAMIVSSHFEGLPNAVLEAMTIGCPVISTDCLAGPRELLADIEDYREILEPCTVGKRGVLVADAGSEDLLETTYMAQAMDIIANNDELCDQIREHQKVYMDDYCNERIVEQWISIIEKPDKMDKSVLDFDKNMIDKGKKLFIYGAGLVGTEYFKLFSGTYHIEGFLITKKSDGCDIHMGIPLYEIEEFNYNPEEVQIIIGVADIRQDEVLRVLYKYGYKNIVFPYRYTAGIGAQRKCT